MYIIAVQGIYWEDNTAQGKAKCYINIHLSQLSDTIQHI